MVGNIFSPIVKVYSPNGWCGAFGGENLSKTSVDPTRATSRIALHIQPGGRLAEAMQEVARTVGLQRNTRRPPPALGQSKSGVNIPLATRGNCRAHRNPAGAKFHSLPWTFTKVVLATNRSSAAIRLPATSSLANPATLPRGSYPDIAAAAHRAEWRPNGSRLENRITERSVSLSLRSQSLARCQG